MLCTMQTALAWCYILRQTLGRLASAGEARRRLSEIVGASAIIAEHEGETDAGEPAYFFKLTDRATTGFAREIAAHPEWRVMHAAPRWAQGSPAAPKERPRTPFLLRWRAERAG